MTMLITPVDAAPLSASEAIRPVGAPSQAGEGQAAPSFGSVLGDAVAEANRLDQQAAQKVDALASGAIDDLHGTMISVKEADISMKLVGSVRNKILDAFQELWRTSV